MSRADAASEIFLLPSVIIAAHPDDEVLGLGGQLPRMNVTLVHVTDGAPMNLRDARAAGFATKEEYARARRLELLAAMSLAGIPEPKCIALNIGDQEASFRLGELTLRIAGLLQTLQPALVFTHPYEGGHPDHDASSFAVHSALKLLRPKQPEEPLLFEFTSYHAGPKGMETDFLPNSKSSIQQLRLGREECTLKLRMLDCFATQKHMVSQFPIEIEQVRPAPEYDFNEPPHPGTLFYEPFDWGIDGPGWRHMAAETERVLGI